MDLLPPLSPPSSVISSSNSNAVMDSGERNWPDLPRDIVLSIFVKLDLNDLLTHAYSVCTTWRNISKDPSLYRNISMPNLCSLKAFSDLEMLYRRAIDYSCGQTVDVSIEFLGTDDLLRHLANSASHLGRLRLELCYSVTDRGLCEVAEKFPYLEELDISISGLSHESLRAIGRCCPRLKTFKFNFKSYRHQGTENDHEAFAIANSMSGLCHLQLIGNKMTKDGLLAILDRCTQLESLDIRRCYNIDFIASLAKRCKEQIKYLHLPYDATDDMSVVSEGDLDRSSVDDYEFSYGSEISQYNSDDNYYDF